MEFRKRRWIVWGLAGVLLMATSGCGYILYPERRADPLSSEKDTAVIVYDCLWLLAGVIPGVIALVVDGVNDTWYYTEAELAARRANERAQTTIPRGGDVLIRLHGPAPTDATVTLQLQDDAGAAIAAIATTADPTADRQVIALRVPADLAMSTGTLVLAVNGDTQLTWDVRIID